MAASDGKNGKILFANTAEFELKLSINTTKAWMVSKYRVLDGINGLVEAALIDSDSFVIPPFKIVLIEYVFSKSE